MTGNPLLPGSLRQLETDPPLSEEASPLWSRSRIEGYPHSYRLLDYLQAIPLVDYEIPLA